MEKPADQVWYLHEWFASVSKKQYALINELGWPAARANRIWHGIQPFKREDLTEIAAFLNIRPHELLMRPDEAFRIRRMEAALAEVAESTARPFEHQPPASGKSRTGTEG